MELVSIWQILFLDGRYYFLVSRNYGSASGVKLYKIDLRLVEILQIDYDTSVKRMYPINLVFANETREGVKWPCIKVN